MRRHYEEITAKGADVVAIGTGDARYAAAFIADEQIPFRVLIDERGAAARAAQVRRGGLVALVGPQSVAAGAKAFAKGHRQHKTGKRPAQLAATFVIAPGDEVLFEHYAAHAADHAPVAEVVAALPTT